MKQLVDVINFNADASCLSTEQWFRILDGGENSELYRWLRLYVTHRKKVALGLTGATVADMAAFNPEAIALIAAAPEIFQVIARPFSHDIALLRTEAGFRANLALGLAAIRREFGDVAPYFLPPEFMLTNDQVAALGMAGIRGTFINPGRFSADLQMRIPDVPYQVKGIFQSQLECIPFAGHCTSGYLKAIHLFDATAWNEAVLSTINETVYTWRDGESSFFLPDGVEREAAWLAGEDASVVRLHLGEPEHDYLANNQLGDGMYHSYPVHSFLPWMREFRMLAFVNRVVHLEQSIAEHGIDDSLFAWLMSTGSDILSAIEKKSPVVDIAPRRGESTEGFTIMRSERGLEGEEYLLLAERCRKSGKLPLELLNTEGSLHHRRYLARVDYLRHLAGTV